MRILYGQKYNHADLLPAVPSVTTLNFRRPPSVTTFNFSVTTLSCTPGRTSSTTYIPSNGTIRPTVIDNCRTNCTVGRDRK